ncbi:carboxymuconolactone decarboxylase family protein [Pigmentibacter ruber]|uniref:carboxymuconolactone decarboxylase family protein n=1 Tax=Pigmentibacter ruber TaxID=2683196 RepID=UPI00131CF8BC|nr:carboxymuconolactone decarboxylase family protein [Pigmentibacter ruber]
MNRKVLTEKFLATIESRYDGIIVRDLKSNFEKYFFSENLTDNELALYLIALSKTLESKILTNLALEYASFLDIKPEEVEEAQEIPGINGMLNTYHKFRHFIDISDKEASKEYGAVGLRMGILGKSKMPQSHFELIFIAISILNSCEKCVLAHEQHAVQVGVQRSKIHDIVRLTGILKGLIEISKN